MVMGKYKIPAKIERIPPTGSYAYRQENPSNIRDRAPKMNDNFR
jgi:hypothetical protein